MKKQILMVLSIILLLALTSCNVNKNNVVEGISEEFIFEGEKGPVNSEEVREDISSKYIGFTAKEKYHFTETIDGDAVVLEGKVTGIEIVFMSFKDEKEVDLLTAESMFKNAIDAIENGKTVKESKINEIKINEMPAYELEYIFKVGDVKSVMKIYALSHEGTVVTVLVGSPSEIYSVAEKDVEEMLESLVIK